MFLIAQESELLLCVVFVSLFKMSEVEALAWWLPFTDSISA